MDLQARRIEKSPSLEVKANRAKLVFQKEISDSEQAAFLGHYILSAREDMWRISACTILH